MHAVDVDESKIHIKWKKKKNSNKRVPGTWFYLRAVQEQVKPKYGRRNYDNGLPKGH